MPGGSSFFTVEEQEPVSIRGLILALILHLELLCLLLATGNKMKKWQMQRRDPNIWISFARNVSYRCPLPNILHKGSHFTSKPPWERQGLSWQPRETETSVHPCAQQGREEIKHLGYNLPGCKTWESKCDLSFDCWHFQLPQNESEWFWSSFGVPECLQIQMEMCKTNLLDDLSSSAAYLKAIEVASTETLGHTSIQKQAFWKWDWKLHEVCPKYLLRFSSSDWDPLCCPGDATLS